MIRAIVPIRTIKRSRRAYIAALFERGCNFVVHRPDTGFQPEITSGGWVKALLSSQPRARLTQQGHRCVVRLGGDLWCEFDVASGPPLGRPPWSP